MTTDVKTSMLPVPGTESNVPVKRTQQAVRPDRGSADGRKFAEELSRGTQSSNPPVKTDQVANDQIKEKADQVRDGMERVASQVKVPGQPTAEQLQGAVEQVIPEGTLDMKTLKLAARKQSPLARSSDAIEFLTGKLDKIDPSQISHLVSENEFITEGLAAKDIGDFMRLPAPVEKLLEQLQVPDEIAATLQAAGINLSDTISPQDFLRALGVDPGRVHAEIDLLKQNLPVDGVVPYVQRAERMQGLRSSTAPASSSAQEATTKATTQQAAKRTATQGSAASLAAATAKASPITTGPSVPVGGMNAALQTPLANMGGASTPQMNGGLQQAAVPAPEVAAPQMASPERVASSAVQTPQMGTVPKMNATNVDPFAEMGKRSADFVSVDTTQVAKVPVDVEEALMQTQWKPGQQVVATKGQMTSAIDGQLLNLGQKNPVATATNTIPTIDVTQVAEEIEVDPQQLQAKATQPIVNQGVKVAMPTQVAPKMTTSTLDTRMPIEDLQLEAPQADWQAEDLMASSDQGSFTSDGGGEQSFSERKGLEVMGLGTLASASRAVRAESAFGSQLQVDPSHISTADRAQAVQQLMDRALTMVRQGGGAMQIDLSGLNLGQLEMAVSVAGDRVDIKMLTDSNQMRDVLSGDIGQLREALASQNMSLGSVDVGIDNSESDAEQMLGGQDFREDAENQADQLHQDFEDFVTSAVSAKADLAERAEVIKRMPVMPPINQQGSIAVRV